MANAGSGTTGGTWRPVLGADSVWRAESVVSGVPLRSVAVRLRDGQLAVYSPIRGLPRAAHAQLAALGRPALLVAPNHFHNLGLPEYASAHAGAAIVSSATAAPRLRRRCGHPVGDESALRARLPADAAVLVPPATRAGEMWLSLLTPAGRAWVVGDGFFNIARTPRTPMGLLLSALGISPGLRIGSSYRWLIRDRAAYRTWLLDQLSREAPTVLIPCHGEILSDSALPARLRQLVESRL